MRMLLAAALGSVVLPLAAVDAAAQTPFIPPETTFTPLTPCRAFDTRLGARPARIPANSARAFRINGATGFVEQGGKDGGCGVPDWASAVALSISAFPANKSSTLVAWSGQGAKPAAASMSYGTQLNTSLVTSQTFMFGVAIGLNGPAADVAGDVVGYFAPKMWGVIGENGVVVKNSGRVVSASIQITGNYRVIFDRDITACVVTATSQSFGVIVSQGGTQFASAFVYARNASGASVPGAFSINVDC